MDKLPLNFALMGNWENWFIILLMLVIFSFAVDLLFNEFVSTKKETN